MEISLVPKNLKYPFLGSKCFTVCITDLLSSDGRLVTGTQRAKSTIKGLEVPSLFIQLRRFTPSDCLKGKYKVFFLRRNSFIRKLSASFGLLQSSNFFRFIMRLIVALFLIVALVALFFPEDSEAIPARRMIKRLRRPNARLIRP